MIGLLASPHLARAQIAPQIADRPGEEHIRSGYGVSIQGGGGVTDFTGQSARGVTNFGGAWDLRVVLGTRRLLAIEGAYVGSDHSMSADTRSELIGNGFEGALRLNAPFLQDQVLMEPFAFVGLGWSHYYVSNVSGLAVSANGDSVGTVPIGAGLAIGYRGFLADARFTYRPAFDDDNLVVAHANRALNLDAWNASLMLGFEF